jgi:hypothetical protein
MNSRVTFHERLSPISVMNIPVHYEDALRSMFRPRMMSGDRDVAEKTETHGPVVQRMMPWRANSYEAAKIAAGESPIDCFQRAPGSRPACVPGSLTGNCVCVEPSAALSGNLPDALDILRTMNARQLFRSCMSAFDLRNGLKQLRIIAQRASDCAQASDVLWMAPSCIVAATVGM